MENHSMFVDQNQTANTTTVMMMDDYLRTFTFFHIFVTVLGATALIAMIINVIVFASVHWIRRPMSPILKMSISLAAADALSSTIFALSLLFSTYLPVIGINLNRLQIVLEIIKLSGILVTVTHLLALSLNHYIGIIKPLHYNSIVTRRKVTTVTILLWLIPTAYVIFLFTSQADENYWRENFSENMDNSSDHINKTTFIDTFRFRMSYSSFIIISVLLMAVCYMHILIIVRRQQNIWKNLSRVGSTKWTSRTMKNSHSNSNKALREQRQLEGNIRAIYTTLLILGSCVIGWMPALLIFVLICKEDCRLNGGELERINKTYLIEVMCMRMLENMLIILKMFANPIIYSIRMKEIQEGTKHMQLALAKIFRPHRPDSRNYTLAARRSPNAACSNSSLRTRVTASVHNGEGGGHVTIGRTDIVNTLL